MKRDIDTNAILNIDYFELNKYRLEKKKIKDIEKLKVQMQDIHKCISNINDRINQIESIINNG